MSTLESGFAGLHRIHPIGGSSEFDETKDEIEDWLQVLPQRIQALINYQSFESVDFSSTIPSVFFMFFSMLPDALTALGSDATPDALQDLDEQHKIDEVKRYLGRSEWEMLYMHAQWLCLAAVEVVRVDHLSAAHDAAQALAMLFAKAKSIVSSFFDLEC